MLLKEEIGRALLPQDAGHLAERILYRIREKELIEKIVNNCGDPNHLRQKSIAWRKGSCEDLIIAGFGSLLITMGLAV